MENYQAVFKRKEIKYLLSREERDALLPILKAYMEPDAFAHSSISNLYYDTPDFRMVRRSLEKPMYKEKLRLRSYGTPEDTSTVFPEIKKKAMGIVYKRRISLPYQKAVSFLSGQQIASVTHNTAPERPDRAHEDSHNAPDSKFDGTTQQIPSTDIFDGTTRQIFHELDWMLASYEDLAPRVFLSYERDSYKGISDPSLRLTLDQDILFRTDRLDLREGAFGEAILLPDQTLMEVKISNAAPLWLAQALSEIGIFPVSFSKYGRAYERICRDPRRRQEMNEHAEIDVHAKINGHTEINEHAEIDVHAKIDAHTKINGHAKEMEMKRYA